MSQKKVKIKKIESKLAENFKSCRKSQKLPKILKAAEKLPSNLWLSLLLGLFYDQQLLSNISLPRFLCVKKKVQKNAKDFLLKIQTHVNVN